VIAIIVWLVALLHGRTMHVVVLRWDLVSSTFKAYLINSREKMTYSNLPC